MKKTRALILIIFLTSGLISSCYKKEYNTTTDYYKLLQTEPEQQEITHVNLKYPKNDVELTSVASYKISARVLSKEKYWFDKESNISPIDLALGWGNMSNKEKLKDSKISVHQNTRFYYWYVPAFNVLSRTEIETHSANTHIVPATKEIESYVINKINNDDLIYMEGFLINARDKKNNKHWNTSLVRNDTGSGACELFYVTKIIHLIDLSGNK